MDMIYSADKKKITLEKKGADSYTKISYPLRYGRYSEIEDETCIFQFNLNGEIIFAKEKGRTWPDPQEWLKRSVGNDWIYYSTGGYTGVYEAIGEFYLPNLQYPSNSLIGGKPFEKQCVKNIVEFWHDRLCRFVDTFPSSQEIINNFLDKLISNTPQKLAEKAEKLFQLSGGRVTVLPPDSRHVDYNCIPLTISYGCLYKCRFCKVKSAKPFQELEAPRIEAQLDGLVALYSDDIVNYNSVFLGEHDALLCRPEHILSSIVQAYEKLRFSASLMRGANFFCFGSVDSFLGTPEKLFEDLRRLPYNFYFNIGLESADQETLDILGKPLSAKMVRQAFLRIQEINDRYLNIEITANFLMDHGLPKNHYPAFLALVRDSVTRNKPKGCIYLSPLSFDAPSRELVFDFNKLKLLSRLPTFLYIIQRL